MGFVYICKHIHKYISTNAPIVPDTDRVSQKPDLYQT